MDRVNYVYRPPFQQVATRDMGRSSMYNPTGLPQITYAPPPAPIVPFSNVEVPLDSIVKTDSKSDSKSDDIERAKFFGDFFGTAKPTETDKIEELTGGKKASGKISKEEENKLYDEFFSEMDMKKLRKKCRGKCVYKAPTVGHWEEKECDICTKLEKMKPEELWDNDSDLYEFLQWRKKEVFFMDKLIKFLNKYLIYITVDKFIDLTYRKIESDLGLPPISYKGKTKTKKDVRNEYIRYLKVGKEFLNRMSRLVNTVKKYDKNVDNASKEPLYHVNADPENIINISLINSKGTIISKIDIVNERATLGDEEYSKEATAKIDELKSELEKSLKDKEKYIKAILFIPDKNEYNEPTLKMSKEIFVDKNEIVEGEWYPGFEPKGVYRLLNESMKGTPGYIPYITFSDNNIFMDWSKMHTSEADFVNSVLNKDAFKLKLSDKAEILEELKDKIKLIESSPNPSSDEIKKLLLETEEKIKIKEVSKLVKDTAKEIDRADTPLKAIEAAHRLEEKLGIRSPPTPPTPLTPSAPTESPEELLEKEVREYFTKGIIMDKEILNNVALGKDDKIMEPLNTQVLTLHDAFEKDEHKGPYANYEQMISRAITEQVEEKMSRSNEILDKFTSNLEKLRQVYSKFSPSDLIEFTKKIKEFQSDIDIQGKNAQKAIAGTRLIRLIGLEDDDIKYNYGDDGTYKSYIESLFERYTKIPLLLTDKPAPPPPSSSALLVGKKAPKLEQFSNLGQNSAPSSVDKDIETSKENLINEINRIKALPDKPSTTHSSSSSSSSSSPPDPFEDELWDLFNNTGGKFKRSDDFKKDEIPIFYDLNNKKFVIRLDKKEFDDPSATDTHSKESAGIYMWYIENPTDKTNFLNWNTNEKSRKSLITGGKIEFARISKKDLRNGAPIYKSGEKYYDIIREARETIQDPKVKKDGLTAYLNIIKNLKSRPSDKDEGELYDKIEEGIKKGKYKKDFSITDEKRPLHPFNVLWDLNENKPVISIDALFLKKGENIKEYDLTKDKGLFLWYHENKSDPEKGKNWKVSP